METFDLRHAPTSNLSLERWVNTRVVGWGRWADGCSLRWFTDVVSFLLFCRSLTETMSTLDWSEGNWKAYGKDLETVLQSQEARSCTQWGFCWEGSLNVSHPLFDRLDLSHNQLSIVPDCICQLPNLTEYDIISDLISFLMPSFIGFISTAISWLQYRTVLAIWQTWPSTTFNLSLNFNSHSSLW